MLCRSHGAAETRGEPAFIALEARREAMRLPCRRRAAKEPERSQAASSLATVATASHSIASTELFQHSPTESKISQRIGVKRHGTINIASIEGKVPAFGWR